MGLFDESSESDNEGPPNIATAGGGGTDDEEEDTLEAYMKSLDAVPAAPTTKPSSGGRLDVDAEDEATSHWEISSKAKPIDDPSDRLLPKHEGGEEMVTGSSSASSYGASKFEAQQQQARSAMSSTFVSAGGGSKNKDNQSASNATNYNDNDDDDEDEDKFTNLQSIHKHQTEMLHQEVAPLDRVDHRQMHYARFNRVFYTPMNTEAGAAWRKEHEVVCTPGHFDPILGFGDLGSCSSGSNQKGGEEEIGGGVFPEELIRTIAKSGYDSPTLVQSQTLSVALSGHDALITAATGSGKTLAYIWPMIVHINDQPHIEPGVDGPIGVVLTPTRELAKQVYKYAKTFVECIGGKAVEVAGGNRGTWELTKELKKGCEIVVSSPGRLIDMVKKKGTNLKRVTFLVLDEADRSKCPIHMLYALNEYRTVF